MKDTRKSDLAKIHIAKKQLAMSDADYEAAIGKVSKGRTTSAGDLDVRERGMLLTHFGKCGFKPAPKKHSPTSRPASPRQPMDSKARALWLYAHELGVVRDASERALASFAEKLTGASDLRFTSPDGLYPVVEAIKAMCLRKLPEVCAELHRQMYFDERVPQITRAHLYHEQTFAKAAQTFPVYQKYHAALLRAASETAQRAAKTGA